MNRLLFFFLFPLLSFGQLPNDSLIKKLGITSVEIYHHALRPDVMELTDLDHIDKDKLYPDTTPEHITTYFFNDRAQIDSMHYWSQKSFGTMHYMFDAEGRVIRQRNVQNGEETLLQEVTRLPDGRLEYKWWNYGVLRDHYITTADSVLLETFRPELEQNHYFKYTYTPELNQVEYKMIDWKSGRVESMRRERWSYALDGSIDTVYMHFEQTRKNARKNNLGSNLNQTYVFNEAGEMIPSSTLNIPRPVFFRNLKRTKFIAQYESFRRNASELLFQTEPYTAFTYERVNPRGYYSFVYHFAKEK